jgi:hypothetical protein
MSRVTCDASADAEVLSSSNSSDVAESSNLLPALPLFRKMVTRRVAERWRCRASRTSRTLKDTPV